MGTLVSSTNKTDRHDITEILLKVTLNTITLHTPFIQSTGWIRNCCTEFALHLTTGKKQFHSINNYKHCRRTIA
jgi:hypothetical protein